MSATAHYNSVNLREYDPGIVCCAISNCALICPGPSIKGCCQKTDGWVFCSNQSCKADASLASPYPFTRSLATQESILTSAVSTVIWFLAFEPAQAASAESGATAIAPIATIAVATPVTTAFWIFLYIVASWNCCDVKHCSR